MRTRLTAPGVTAATHVSTVVMPSNSVSRDLSALLTYRGALSPALTVFTATGRPLTLAQLAPFTKMPTASLNVEPVNSSYSSEAKT